MKEDIQKVLAQLVIAGNAAKHFQPHWRNRTALTDIRGKPVMLQRIGIAPPPPATQFPISLRWISEAATLAS